MYNDWKAIWIIYRGMTISTIRPYVTQYSIICSSAPSIRLIGLMSIMKRMVSMIPMMNSVFTIMEKVRQARSLSPWPRIMATRALPPVPNMRPIAPVIIMAGQIRLRAAKGVVPVKFDTNRPSAIL